MKTLVLIFFSVILFVYKFDNNRLLFGNETQEGNAVTLEISATQNEDFEKIYIRRCDTALINKKIFTACENKDWVVAILNDTKDTIYTHHQSSGFFEFRDFNHDGFKDILIACNMNIPDKYDLALYNKNTNRFHPVDSFNKFPAPVKITGTQYYYSYHRNGCADSDWVSNLFYIKDFQTFRMGTIYGRGCTENDETGIFISKVKDGYKELIKKIPREPGYYHEKWDFIKEYWTKNYTLFE